MTKFADLGLLEPIQRVLPEMGIDTPSEIQEKAIPLLLTEEKDFIGLAQTGTGKTAAFGLPLLNSIDIKSKKTQALVLAPTRELGLQIADQLKMFSKYMKGLHVEAVYGGANIVPQIKALKKGTQVVIATPGRLIDLLKRKALTLDNVSRVVLDEADEMLNMGFREDIDLILSYAPKDHNTWLFSATMSPGIRKIVDKYMSSPNEVKIGGKSVVNKNIDHQFLKVGRSKRESLKHYIDVHENVRGVVFCKTKAETKETSDALRKEGYSVDAINGDLTQNVRERVMKMFKAHELDILIATDVAARGIDVNDLTHVFHFNIPDDQEYYTHRSGRTARAGKKGESIVFVRKSEQRKLRFLERDLKIDFTEITLPGRREIAQSKTLASAMNLVAHEAAGSVPPAYIEQVVEVFAELSKEEIVKKFMDFELSKNGYFAPPKEDKSEGRRSERGSREERGERTSRNDRRDRGDRRERPSRDRKERTERSERKERPSRDRKEKTETSSNPDFVKFYINVGTKDGVRKGDLIEFLCDQSGLGRKSVGQIDVEQKHSYFEIEKAKSKGLPDFFEGIEVNGRSLKVSREDK